MNKIDEIIKQYEGAGRDSLIPMLQDIQEEMLFISKEAVEIVGKQLNLPASKIYGVATFYNQFRFNKPGHFHIQICRGTACHVKGSLKVLETLEREMKLKVGETSRDGVFSLEEVACLGACGLAPVLSVNGEFHAGMDSKRIKMLIKKLRQEGKSYVQAQSN